MRALIVLLWCVLIAGCASAKKGPLEGLFTFKAADKIQAAEKITGIEKAKVADEAVGSLGINNETKSERTTAGRDISSVNDSEVIKEYMQRDAEKNTEIIKLHRYIIGGFIMLLLKAYAIIFWAMKSLLKARDRDDEAEQKLMQHFITKKEAV